MDNNEIKLLKRLEQRYLANISTFTDIMLEYKDFVRDQLRKELEKNNKTKY